MLTEKTRSLSRISVVVLALATSNCLGSVDAQAACDFRCLTSKLPPFSKELT